MNPTGIQFPVERCSGNQAHTDSSQNQNLLDEYSNADVKLQAAHRKDAVYINTYSGEDPSQSCRRLSVTLGKDQLRQLP